ncbi:MAG: right-handed parallel beta-helix repeat-containing protein [Thermoguttaceae bacterium]|nr:right-handed parallel beta-helix repeat-containing protein [Thermoguttaceae bacterium]
MKLSQARLLSFLLFTALFLPAFGLAAAERVISVSPGEGLAAAVEKAEAILPTARACGDSVVIELADGMYELEETLVLTPAISGTQQAPTVFRAADGARPVISGGRVLTGFAAGGDGYWHLTIDAVKNGDWYFQQLYVNNRRAERPRLPKEGCYTIDERIFYGEVDENADAKTKDQCGELGLRFTSDEIRSDLRGLADIDFCAPQRWVMSRNKIDSIDDAEKVIHIKGHFSRSQWRFGKGFRFFLENVREALGAPGQFYLDRSTGELTYIPREGETIDTAAVVAPRLSTLVAVAGSKEKPVENLRFEGLFFAHSSYVTPALGNGASQAETPTESSIQLTRAEGIAFDGCGFHSLGNHALLIGTASKNCAVASCAFRDIGGGGVRIGGNYFGTKGFAGEHPFDDSILELSKEERLPTENSVSDCVMEYLGRVHPASIGVWIGFASNTTVERCEIFDLYYSAVSIGWIWGYNPDPAPSVGNIVRQCHMHKIGQRYLSDMGAVYTLGISPGTKVTHNLIHDVKSYEYGGWGLYTDEGSTYVEMAHNVVYNTQTGSFHQHYGRDNQIHHNILVNSAKCQLVRSRAEDHCSFHLTNNIVYWENDSPLLSGNWKDGQFDINNNLYWNTAAKENLRFGDNTFEQWREKGRDTDSRLADPLFRDVANGDFTFEGGSPAANFGIEILDHYGPAVRPTICDDIPAPGACFPLPIPGTEPAAVR